MLANFHTHCTYCDGKDTPEDVVLAAIEKGFYAIGFTSHGNTPFDAEYCMQDTEGYIACISALKDKYKKQIQIYLGLEEDMHAIVDRRRFDYIIGSSHYLHIDGRYLPLDSGYACFQRCLRECADDPLKLAQIYFEGFCDYIHKRKPDIVGHFDLITKYEECQKSLYLENRRYVELASRYIAYAAESGCVFEVNTGAMARVLRTGPYPQADLLHVLKKHNAPLILSSDCHSAEKLDFGFDQAQCLLRDIGFTELYTIDNGKFKSYKI